MQLYVKFISIFTLINVATGKFNLETSEMETLLCFVPTPVRTFFSTLSSTNLKTLMQIDALSLSTDEIEAYLTENDHTLLKNINRLTRPYERKFEKLPADAQVFLKNTYDLFFAILTRKTLTDFNETKSSIETIATNFNDLTDSGMAAIDDLLPVLTPVLKSDELKSILDQGRAATDFSQLILLKLRLFTLLQNLGCQNKN
uniref:WSN domain-containing protein n=1 Tax=Panagrellus redivivus TaxID=6233 RepID=A0A7E4V4H7_PANRE